MSLVWKCPYDSFDDDDLLQHSHHFLSVFVFFYFKNICLKEILKFYSYIFTNKNPIIIIKIKIVPMPNETPIPIDLEDSTVS